ncbi:MAG TPA: hypothetical protein VFR37_07625, partial [Longimicrobium sp.]|nr:hypothetical protein [Longimicrobium sp.]
GGPRPVARAGLRPPRTLDHLSTLHVMKPALRASSWLATAGLGTALFLGACTDRGGSPTTDPPPIDGPPGEPVMLQALECRATVATRQVTCANATPPSGPSYLIVGNQNVYVTMANANVNHDPGTGLFTTDVTVRNLIPQPLGTTDSTAALAADPDGVRVFFSTPPAVTAGSGTVTVTADGQDFITAANQDYYQYNTVLEQFEVSAPKTWTFNVSAGVEAFYFAVLISAAVPWPDGYVLITGNFNVRSGDERQLTARAYNAVGELDPVQPSFTWNAVDSTRAEVNGTGLVHGQRAGSTFIVATEVGGATRHGKVDMTVRPIRRTWTALAGTTDWHTSFNWIPDSILPEPTDTVVIPAAPAGGALFPVLADNDSVGGIEVDVAPALIALGAFNLTATGDVHTATGGMITGTVGQMVLAGPTSHTVAGTFPRVLVTGRYSLDGNVLLNNRLRIQGGRLRNQSFRVRVNNP